MTPGICMGVGLLLSLLSSASSYACSMAAWSPGASGSVAANGPASGVPSVGGGCGLAVTGAGYVQDNLPDKEGQFIGRFYFLPQLSGTGSADLFVAYSNETSAELFSVRYDGSHIILDATAAIGGSTTPVAVDANRWHLLEFKWKSGHTGSLWVDADATQDPASATFASGAGSVDAIRLGAPNGLGGLTGTIYFDDYVSHRSQPVGGVLAGDANSDMVIDAADIQSVIDQFLYGYHDGGVTDCNLDGQVNSGDVDCIVANF